MDSKTNSPKSKQAEVLNDKSSRKKLPKNLQALYQKYEHLIEEFEAINNNSAYDAVIHYLKTELEQLQALTTQIPQKQPKR